MANSSIILTVLTGIVAIMTIILNLVESYCARGIKTNIHTRAYSTGRYGFTLLNVAIFIYAMVISCVVIEPVDKSLFFVMDFWMCLLSIPVIACCVVLVYFTNRVQRELNHQISNRNEIDSYISGLPEQGPKKNGLQKNNNGRLLKKCPVWKRPSSNGGFKKLSHNGKT